MKYDNVEKNKVYEKTSMSDAEKKELLANCLKKREEILSEETNTKDEPISDFIVKRNEKMNKNDGIGRVFKYVGVAAFAIITSGAIIGGVANYQNGKNNMPAKTGVIATTEKPTEEVKDPVVNKEVEFDNSTYKVIYGNDYGVNYPGNDGIEISGIKFKVNVKDNNEYLYVKGKDDKDFKEVIDLYCVGDVYTNGEYIYYLDGKEGEKIYKYNIKENKLEETNVVKTIKDTAPENIDDESNHVFFSKNYVFNDVMYISARHTMYDKDNNEHDECDIYALNLISGETKRFKEDRAILEAHNNCLVTRRYMNPDNQECEQYETYIEMIKGDKLEEITSLGELSDIVPTELTVSRKYFYFEKFEKTRDELYCDKSEVKLLRISKDDLGSEVKAEEVATLKTSYFSRPVDEDIEINKVKDKYCEVVINYEYEYRYTYETKKVEDL